MLVCPGPVNTKMTDDLGPDLNKDRLARTD